MEIETINYRCGQQIISPNIVENLVQTIKSIYFTDVRNFNKELMMKLQTNGWSDSYPLSVYSKISLTSVNNKIGLCVQTGNVARVYADLLKLQTMYVDEKIEAGIFVLPSKEFADSIGENVANCERTYRELFFIFSKVITVPMLIISICS